MKNFIFKSQQDFHKIVFNKLETIQTELRHNRADMSMVLHMLNKLVVNQNLQKQVDDYFDDESPEDNPPTEDKHNNIPEVEDRS